ncbi:MAG: hypothetical protein CVT95_11620 [Bacteroidetes bacterium HGW-Bacteroidetes-12]|nr:MAG: hypothetical protein CVT95_11620 [Bacteroidetes bacterium HGW-Bacteroidetes-12]
MGLFKDENDRNSRLSSRKWQKNIKDSFLATWYNYNSSNSIVVFVYLKYSHSKLNHMINGK